MQYTINSAYLAKTKEEYDRLIKTLLEIGFKWSDKSREVYRDWEWRKGETVIKVEDGEIDICEKCYVDSQFRGKKNWVINWPEEI